MIPYPNRIQWAIIWVTILFAAHVWLGLTFADLWYQPNASWGVTPYLSKALPAFDPCCDPKQPAAAFAIVVIGGLLAWQASTWKQKTPAK